MWIIVAMIAVSFGCSGLIVRDSDTTAEKTGKVAARTVLAIPTMGFSEIGMQIVKEEDTFKQWWGQASDEERLAWTKAERERLNRQTNCVTVPTGYAYYTRCN